MMPPLKSQLAILLTLLFLAGVAVLLSSLHMMPRYIGLNAASEMLGDSIRIGKAPIPAFSTSTRERLAGSHGFQALVSYTDNGFEPAKLTVKKGETIRFTNNSSRDIWVAASGNPLYPSVENGCGSSAFDSCAPFAPMDFWEFTFEQKGQWHVVNNLDKEKSALIKVE
ncbi:hypothetical protein HY971_05130 [Candidatus Kaiserbacteria bacterium]|nr:hypothetical protein [Candidatus Kaiserbacteria bacterium]